MLENFTKIEIFEIFDQNGDFLKTSNKMKIFENLFRSRSFENSHQFQDFS